MTAIAHAAGESAPLSTWRRHGLVLAVVVAAILLLFRRDAVDMVSIWIESSTYNHCLLVPPLIGWLVWQRWPELHRLDPSGWAPGLLLVAAGAFGWLLGEAGSVALARHAGLVLMIQGAAVTILGLAVSRGLAFPIFYAVFMIPVGDEIVPMMQTVTAALSMALLGLLGVPAHIEGVFISVPNGYYEVAEACAGVMFLVAMVAYGALVANVCFRSWPRRIAFMAAAVAIPIVANGIRAGGTIYVGYLTSAEAAVGFDHIVYGWIFFAVVIALLMAVGWPFFDRGPNDPWFDPEALKGAGRTRPLGAVAIAVVILAALPLAWSSAVTAGDEPTRFALPDVPGWQRIARDGGRPWSPHFAGADQFEIARYRDSAGREVDLAIALFARQSEGREMVGYGQGALPPDGAWAWTQRGPAPPGGRLDRIASFGTIREVATFYRVGGRTTGSDTIVKWETMKARLLGGPQAAVAILVSAEAPGEGASARPTIDAFLADLGPIDRLGARIAGH